MPNHVTNIVEANPVVINAMLNDDGFVDFKVINPMPDDLSINGASGFYGDAETAAKLMCREKLSESHFFARLEASNRREVNALNMTDESFEQFVCMMRNKRKHGFYHSMDFARNVWGTKWGAYNSSKESDNKVSFETAWPHPFPVLKSLSQKFPNEEITVNYADEDTGSNCGYYTIKNGEIIVESIAPSWNEQTDEEKRKWTEFAFKLNHPDSNPREYGYNENWEYDESLES